MHICTSRIKINIYIQFRQQKCTNILIKHWYREVIQLLLIITKGSTIAIEGRDCITINRS